MFSHSLFIKNKAYFPEGITSEGMPFLIFVALRLKKMIYIPNVFYNYYIRENSITNRGIKVKRIDDVFTSYSLCIQYLREKNVMKQHGWTIDKINGEWIANFKSMLISDVYENREMLLQHINKKMQDADERVLLFEQARQYFEEQKEAILRSPTFRLGKFFMFPLRFLKLMFLKIAKLRRKAL